MEDFDKILRQFNELLGNGKPLRANVNRCPRCQGSHKRILFDYKADKERRWTHVGTCPVKGGLIFLKRTEGKGAKLV